MSKQDFNFTTNPRQIRWDWEDGLITTPERNLLYELRSMGNPYGFCSVEMGSLAKHTFNTPVDKSYINKLLLSLKGKRYIWYKERKGCRGSFRIHLDQWLLKDKTLSNLDRYFHQSLDSSNTSNDYRDETEEMVEVFGISQRLKDEESTENIEYYKQSIRETVRGYENEKENKNKKEKDTPPKFF